MPEYWVVDLRRRVVVRHIDPADGTYRTVAEHGSGDKLEIEGIEVDLAWLLDG